MSLTEPRRKVLIIGIEYVVLVVFWVVLGNYIEVLDVDVGLLGLDVPRVSLIFQLLIVGVSRCVTDSCH